MTLRMGDVVRVARTESPLGKVWLRFGDGCVAVRWIGDPIVRNVFRPDELEKPKVAK